MPNNSSAISSFRSVPRYAIFVPLIFTPLARASVQEWAITIIQMVTLIALTAFLFEKAMSWDWKWIKTPLDKPFIVLLILTILSTIFSVHKPTSIWSTIQLLNHLLSHYPYNTHQVPIQTPYLSDHWYGYLSRHLWYI